LEEDFFDQRKNIMHGRWVFFDQRWFLVVWKGSLMHRKGSKAWKRGFLPWKKVKTRLKEEFYIRRGILCIGRIPLHWKMVREA